MSPLAGRKAVLGAAIWTLAAIGLAGAWTGLDPAAQDRAARVKREMWRALVDPVPTYTILFPGEPELSRGNGVLARVDGRLERVGEIVQVRDEGPHRRATIAIDEGTVPYRPRAGAEGVRRSQGRSFLVAAKLLLPESRRRRIEQEWRSFVAEHRDALAHELEPLAGRLLSVTLQAIAAEAPAAIERHRAEIDAIVARMREGLGREQVLPLLIEELWPIVTRHAAAPAETIGRELWDRLPLMSFALRAAADRVLEDEPVRVEERWREFVQEEALPTLREHDEEMAQAFGAIVKDVLASEQIQARAAAVWSTIRDDAEVQALARALTRELIAENAHLAAALRGLADDPEVRQRLERLAARFETFLDPLGNLLLLDATGEGINPDLAYLIRLLLLERDAQLIHLTEGEGPRLEPGAELPGRDES